MGPRFPSYGRFRERTRPMLQKVFPPVGASSASNSPCALRAVPVQASFDAYCLEQAAPGTSHTGVYLFSFDFVYVGNHHIRNLLMMSALLSVFQSILLFATSCIMLNALRLEKETGFTSWLMVMGVFIIWRVLAWAYGSIVNDMIFGYHIFTLVIWMALSTAGTFSWAVVYSLYLELTSITKIETCARIKMDTMGSSRFQN